jgi:hypothetical protein
VPPWVSEAIAVYFFAFVAGLFVALLCQVTLPGGAAVIALLITAAFVARSPR